MNKTPLETIRSYCLYCNGGNDAEVRRCDADGKTPGFDPCPFHPYRMGRGRPSVKIIRLFCLQCMGGSRDFVSTCTTYDCLCFPYRMGKSPARIGKGYFADQARKKVDPARAVQGTFAIQNQRSAIGTGGRPFIHAKSENRG